MLVPTGHPLAPEHFSAGEQLLTFSTLSRQVGHPRWESAPPPTGVGGHKGSFYWTWWPEAPSVS